MFHTLYQRYGDKTQSNTDAPVTSADNSNSCVWPGTYGEGLTQLEPPIHPSLRIDGRVASPVTLDEAEIRALPKTVLNRATISAQGWTYKAPWEGVLLKDLLAKVQPTSEPIPEGAVLKQTNLLGQIETFPLTQTVLDNTLLCYQVDGQPLQPLQGGPFWLMVFDRYNYKGLGQVAALTVLSQNEAAQEPPGYWTQRGYDVEGTIKPADYYAFDQRQYVSIQDANDLSA